MRKITTTKELTLKDINSDKIKVSPKSKIDRIKRAEVLLDVLNGKTMREVAGKYNYSTKTIQGIKNNNTELLQQITTRILTEKLEKEEFLIFQILELIQEKLDQLKRKGEVFDDTKLTELSNTMKDLFNKVQIQKGQPTSISEQYINKDIRELKLNVIAIADTLKSKDKNLLTKQVFDDIEDVDNP